MKGALPLEDHQVKAMLEKGFSGRYENRNRALFAAGISTGFRVSELLSLTMRDVMHRKYAKDIIKVDKRHTKGKLAGRKNKLFPFAQKAMQLWINERLDNTETADLLDEMCFPSRKRDALTGQQQAITVIQVNRILDDAAERANISIDISSHTMRKTAANKVYIEAARKFRSGESYIEPIRVVMEFLGHNSIVHTIKYLSFIEQDISAEAFDFGYS